MSPDGVMRDSLSSLYDDVLRDYELNWCEGMIWLCTHGYLLLVSKRAKPSKTPHNMRIIFNY